MSSEARVWLLVIVLLSSCESLLQNTYAGPVMASLYVDPVNGSDGNTGSAQSPFQTIQRAQQAVRLLNGAMTGDIVVNLRGGTYRLTNTLTFTQADSGANGFNIVYQAYTGETPVVSGGVVITNWTSIGGGIYKAIVPNLRFRQLYVNGVRGVRARTPNIGAYSRLINWDTNNLVINVQYADVPQFTSDPGNPPEFIAQLRWTAWRGRIASVTSNGPTASIQLMSPERSMMFNKPDPPKMSVEPYHLENAYEFLDQPGEWYLRTSTGELFYMPRLGENMSVAQVVAPKVTSLVTIAGTGLSTPAHDITFSGIVFQDSTWLVPDQYGHVDHQANQFNTMFASYNSNTFYHTEAAIMLSSAQRITITGCTLHNLGAVGIDLCNGAVSNVINGNLFMNIADNPLNDGAPAVSPPNPGDPRTVDKGNRFSNNFITLFGLDYEGATGLFIGYAQNETVEHNEVIDAPYSGISEGWGWSSDPSILGNSIIRNNHVVHNAAALSDSGGIYTLSVQPGSIIQSNYVQDVWFGLYAQHSAMVAIYLDSGSSGIAVQDNVWTNVVGGLINNSVAVQMTNGNTFANNDSQDTNIINSAGILTQYQNIRPWPMPNLGPRDFQGVLPISLGYASGYTIYYTTDGSVPTTTSAVYTGPISLDHTLTLSAIAVDGSGHSSGVFIGNYRQVSRVAETIAVGQPWYAIVVGGSSGSTEQINQSIATGFGWGGYTPLAAQGQSAVTIDPAGRMFFFGDSPSDTMVTPGAYVYTIFSSNGNHVATTSVKGMDKGGDIKITINEEMDAPLKFRFLIRDKNGNWYLSTAATALSIPGGGTYAADATKLAWQQVNTSAQAVMNNLVVGNVDAGPGTITPNASSTTPDLSQVTGGGVYVDTVPSGSNKTFWFYSIQWSAYATPTLPPPWLGQDIGNVGLVGSGSYTNGTFTVAGSGADIWLASDTFYYVYRSLTGDGTITARIKTVQNTDAWAKGGVMIRETLATNSTHASVYVTPSNGVAFQFRNITGGASSNANVPGPAAPYWVRMARSGTTFTGSSSADGTNWTVLGSTTIAMSTNAYIGLAVTSHYNPLLCTATVDNVIISANLPSSPTGLTATGGNQQVALIWTGSASATSYNVKRSTVSGGPYTTVASGLTVTNYTDTALTNNTPYFYVVSAVNINGEGNNSVQASAIPSLPLLAWLSFEGNLNDQAPGQNHFGTFQVTGTYNSNVANPTCGAKALQFANNGNRQVTLANPAGFNLNTGNPFTIVCWFKFNSSQSVSWPTIVMKQPASGWTCATYNRGGLMINGGNGALHYDVSCVGGVDSAVSVNDANWHHGAVVYDGTGYQLYVDGQPSGTAVTFGGCNEGANGEGPWELQIGVSCSSGGTVDEVAFWATALSPAQVNRIYSYGISSVAPPAAPSSLTAAPGDSQVALSWSPAVEASAYNVKRATVSGGPYATVGSGITGTTYTNTPLTNNISYFYVVSAINTNGEGVNSAQVNATPVPAFQTWQMQYFGCTNCAQADPNADPLGKGMNNLSQFLAGLNPTNPASMFHILSEVPQGNDVNVTWQTVGGKTNALQVTIGGYNTNFADLSGPIIITGSGDATTNYVDQGGMTNMPARFYRVRLVP